jgi:hypothetical protein
VADDDDDGDVEAVDGEGDDGGAKDDSALEAAEARNCWDADGTHRRHSHRHMGADRRSHGPLETVDHLGDQEAVRHHHHRLEAWDCRYSIARWKGSVIDGDAVAVTNDSFRWQHCWCCDGHWRFRSALPLATTVVPSCSFVDEEASLCHYCLEQRGP